MYPRFLSIILLSLLIVSSEARAAEEAMRWIDCVKEARAKHPDLVSAAEKIGEARASKEITRSAYLPQITSNADESTSNGSLVSGSGSVNQGVASVQGGSGTSSPGSSTRYTFGATVQQLLFDGFKTSYDLSTAERNINASRYNYDVTSSNVRLRLRTAYSNLLTAQELLKVTEEIEARRKQNFELVRLRYEGGREHRGSLLTSEADLAEATFEVNQAGRSIYLAERQLTKELGRTKFFPMKAVGDLEVKDAQSERPDFERLGETNPLLHQLIEFKEAAKFGIKSAKAQLFPQIFATGSESNSNTDAFPDQNQWSVGTSLSWPMFDGGSTLATIKKARATLGQTEADERSGRDGVILTLSNTWTKLRDTVEEVAVQKKSLEAAQERARIAEAEYSIGILTYDNWIIIEDNLVSAKKSYISAQNNALIAEANWVQAKGGTLDYD